MKPGFYRMRYKVDWDYIDAGGNATNTNNIIANGGGIADVLLNVHKTTSTIKINKTNGDVLKSDNTPFSDTEVPFASAVDVVLSPNQGYKQNGMLIKHGYLSNPKFIHGNRQWQIDTIPATQFTDNRFTIPARLIDGDVEITAEFVLLSGVEKPTYDPNLIINTNKNYLTVVAILPAQVKVMDVTGRTHFLGQLSGVRTFKLNSGVYFVNRQKVIVP